MPNTECLKQTGQTTCNGCPTYKRAEEILFSNVDEKKSPSDVLREIQQTKCPNGSKIDNITLALK